MKFFSRFTTVFILYPSFFISLSNAQSQAPPTNKMDYAIQLIKYFYVDTVDEKKLTDDADRKSTRLNSSHRT